MQMLVFSSGRSPVLGEGASDRSPLETCPLLPTYLLWFISTYVLLYARFARFMFYFMFYCDTLNNFDAFSF